MEVILDTGGYDSVGVAVSPLPKNCFQLIYGQLHRLAHIVIFCQIQYLRLLEPRGYYMYHQV
jgi:hypothetical protein